jgi:hypothetical protein
VSEILYCGLPSYRRTDEMPKNAHLSEPISKGSGIMNVERGAEPILAVWRGRAENAVIHSLSS